MSPCVGKAEGEAYLGSKTVTTDGNRHAEFHMSINQNKYPIASDDGLTYITATATRKHCESAEPGCLYGSTSEFSPACAWDIGDAQEVSCSP